MREMRGELAGAQGVLSARISRRNRNILKYIIIIIRQVPVRSLRHPGGETLEYTVPWSDPVHFVINRAWSGKENRTWYYVGAAVSPSTYGNHKTSTSAREQGTPW